jgi:hypothetical protein
MRWHHKSRGYWLQDVVLVSIGRLAFLNVGKCNRMNGHAHPFNVRRPPLGICTGRHDVSGSLLLGTISRDAAPGCFGD